MHNGIVEVASDGIHLSLTRGFLKLSRKGNELGRVALPDICAVIVRGYGTTLSLNLTARLAEEGIPMVLCGTDQAPAAVVWPVRGHHAQSHIIDGQVSMTLPRRKRLWQSLVQAKIKAQSEALALFGEKHADLSAMATRVRSGDLDNQEAQAARRYWALMMGPVEKNFTRSRNGGGLNVPLNYGYTVLRSGIARAVLAAGLHPGFALHHVSRGDALRLADDLMEPFRPWVDVIVRQLAADAKEPIMELTPERKVSIVNVLTMDLESPVGASPVQVCMDRLAQSLARICLGEGGSLTLPSTPAFSTVQAKEG